MRFSLIFCHFYFSIKSGKWDFHDFFVNFFLKKKKSGKMRFSRIFCHFFFSNKSGNIKWDFHEFFIIFFSQKNPEKLNEIFTNFCQFFCSKNQNEIFTHFLSLFFHKKSGKMRLFDIKLRMRLFWWFSNSLILFLFVLYCCRENEWR